MSVVHKGRRKVFETTRQATEKTKVSQPSATPDDEIGVVTLAGEFYRYEVDRTGARWIGLGYSALICFAYAVVNAFALGRPETQVTYECFALAAVLSVAFPMVQIHLKRKTIQHSMSRLVRSYLKWVSDHNVPAVPQFVVGGVLAVSVILVFEEIPTWATNFAKLFSLFK